MKKLKTLTTLSPLVVVTFVTVFLVSTLVVAVTFKLVPMNGNIYQLVDGETNFNFEFTTYTTATLSEKELCDIHTRGQNINVMFEIANTTSDLSTYFDALTVEVELRESGGGWQQTATTEYDGSTITGGSINMSTTISNYICYVTVTYTSKGEIGAITLGLKIWAE